MKRNTRIPHRLAALLAWALLLALSAHASDQRYDYDEAGRLIRSIDESGQVTEYRYDAVGNLLQINADATAAAPAIDSFTPQRINHGDRLPASATGSGLNGARITTSHPGLTVSGATTADGRVDFELQADPDLPLGPQTLTFTTAAGETSATVEVRPEIPRAYLTPVPVGRLPDGVFHPVILWLSHADVEAHTFALSIDDPAIARLESTTLTLAAGETEARTRVAGLSEGTTSLRAEAPGIAPIAVPVYVAEQLAGINTRYAPRLGVVVESPPAPPAEQSIANLAAPALQVVYGAALQRIEPARRTIGTGPAPLTLIGSGLQGATTLAATPPDGLLFGPLLPAADGTSVTVEATVTADAPLGVRQLTLFDANGTPYPALNGGDRLLITPPPPVIESTAPLYLRPGLNGQTLTLRGRYFNDLYGVDLTPAAGLTVGTPEVAVDGARMVITAPVAIAPDAELGPRTVTVTTAGGSSAATADAANTVYVVLETGTEVPNLTAPPLRVVREAPPTPTSTDYAAYSTPLGLVYGGAITAIAPARAIIGTTLTLTIEGSGLGEAAAVALHPADGITTGTPTVAADGRTLTVALTLAADAPTTVRTVRVTTAGGAALPPATPGATQFLVTPPPPVIRSVTPQVLVADGTPVTLTVHGADFDHAESLRLLPEEGVTVGPLTLNAEATEVSATVTLAPGAAVGPRVVQIVTPGGPSDATAGAANTVTVSDTPPQLITPLLAPLVGIVKESGETPPAPERSAWSAPLGVVLEADPLANAAQRGLYAAPLGIAVGPIARAIDPAGLLPGTTGALLTVTGEGLDTVNEVRLQPADGVTLAAPIIAADGRTLTVALDLDPAAPGGPRAVELIDTAGNPIPFAAPTDGQLWVHAGTPTILSIDPILAGLDDTVTLTIRGEHLQAARAVTATPGDGLQIGPMLQINDLGTEITVPLRVPPGAPLGPRVIRLRLPGYDTPAESSPANTFTVYETVP
ncbi:hypothetical protein [Endothiovibrio diazotrophicus]